jgi:hypothetical protein
VSTLSPGQIYALARNAGLGTSAAVTATAVALAESGGNPDAQGDVSLEDGTWGPSVGLWQIRSLKAEYGKGTPRDASRLTDPQFNAQSMAAISGQGANFGAWTTYTNGAFKSHVADLSPTDIAAGDAGTIPIIGGLLQSDIGGAAGAASAVKKLTDLTSGDLLTLGLKLLATGLAAALLYAGAKRTVTPGGTAS